MMNQYDTDHIMDAAIDDALKTYRLAEPPDTLMPAVITRIQAISSAPRFRLTWFDYAVSLFGAGMAGLVFLLWQQFSWPTFVRFQAQILTGIQHPSLYYLWIPLLGGAALTATAILVAMGIFSRLDFFQPITE